MKITTNFEAISKPKAQGWIKELLELEKRIKDLNDAKAAIYKRVKADYNGAVKDGLQAAVKLIRMEPAQRLQAEAASDYTKLFLAMMDEQPAPANGNTETLAHAREESTASPAICVAAPSDRTTAVTTTATDNPLAQAHEELSFDPDTGEILEPAPARASFPPAMDDLEVAVADVKTVEASPTVRTFTIRGRQIELDELVIGDEETTTTAKPEAA